MTSINLVRSELRKLTTTRMPLAFLAVLGAIAVTNGIAVAFGTDMDGSKAFISTAADQQSLMAFAANALIDRRPVRSHRRGPRVRHQHRHRHLSQRPASIAGALGPDGGGRARRSGPRLHRGRTHGARRRRLTSAHRLRVHGHGGWPRPGPCRLRLGGCGRCRARRRDRHRHPQHRRRRHRHRGRARHRTAGHRAARQQHRILAPQHPRQRDLRRRRWHQRRGRRRSDGPLGVDPGADRALDRANARTSCEPEGGGRPAGASPPCDGDPSPSPEGRRATCSGAYLGHQP